MIRYSLVCADAHPFEGWFRSSDDFDHQAERGLVVCPHCGDTRVSKALMAPRVVTSENKAAPRPAETQPGEDGHDRMTVRGWLGLPDGTRHIEEATSGLASEAQLLGHLLAQRMRAEGGDELLALAEEMAA